MSNTPQPNWINISEISKYNLHNVDILIWQHNLSDEKASRFQRATYIEGYIEVYPLFHRTLFKLSEEGFYEGHDLEGDTCRVTHFALVTPPKNN
jgi:hypothetical protein